MALGDPRSAAAGLVAPAWTIGGVGVHHYENFPVASLLCPPAWRPAVLAIYRFARTADDIADEGHAAPAERRATLERYEACLIAAHAGRVPGSDWPDVFGPLARAIQAHQLPLAPLRDLLSAFAQDCGNPLYADRGELLDYCARSANPVGRLLLHLAGVDDRDALAQSDAICTALQLINFWQDLSVDTPRGRCYVTAADALRHGVPRPLPALDDERTRALLRDLVTWPRELMHEGAPLVHRIRGRFGWELRLVVQGGLRILDKIEAGGFNALSHRPTVGALDTPGLLWRALRMRPGTVNPPRPAARTPNPQRGNAR
jgi:hydroxysqualene synthase